MKKNQTPPEPLATDAFQKRNAYIIALWSSGYPQHEIAKKAGCSIATVRRCQDAVVEQIAWNTAKRKSRRPRA